MSDENYLSEFDDGEVTPLEEESPDNSEPKPKEEAIDPIEEAARKEGWVDQDEWRGDPEQWRDAQTFVDRGQFIKQQQHMRKELNELKEQNRMLIEHQAKVRLDERKAVLEEIREERTKALHDGEYETADRLDREFEEKSEEFQKEKNEYEAQVQAQAAQTQEQLVATFAEWAKENEWYQNDPQMRDYADTIGAGYFNRNKGATIDEVLSYVSAEVNDKYNRGKAPAHARSPVGASTQYSEPHPKRAKGKTMTDLSDEQKAVVKSFEDWGIDPSDYIKELEKLGEI